MRPPGFYKALCITGTHHYLAGIWSPQCLGLTDGYLPIERKGSTLLLVSQLLTATVYLSYTVEAKDVFTPFLPMLSLHVCNYV